MKKTIIIYILFIFSALLQAQEEKNFFSMSKGNINLLLMTVPPASDEGIIVYRRGPLPAAGSFELLNKDLPFKPLLDAEEARDFLSEDWEAITKNLGSDEPFDVLRKIRNSGLAGSLLSMMYPRVAIASGRWFIDSTVQSGREYEYKVIYVDDNLKGKDTIIKKVTIKDIIPAPPSKLTIEAGDAKANLHWTYPKWTGDFSDLAFRFNVYRKTGNGSFEKINYKIILRDDKSAPQFEDPFIQNGLEFTYFVTAIDPIGRESKPSEMVTAKPRDNAAPEAPGGLSAFAGDGSAGLSWYVSPELDADGYNIYRTEGSSKESKKINKKMLPVQTTFYNDSTMKSGVQYFYSVTCVDKSGNESKRSNPYAVILEDKTPPLAPGELTYKFEKRILKLNWKPSKSADVLGYHIYLGADDIVPRITSFPVKGTAYTESGADKNGLEPGKTYTVSVSAVDYSNNESEKVTLKNVFLKDDQPPMPPQDINARNVNGLYIEITCNGSITGDAAKYILYKTTPGAKNASALKEFTEAPFKYEDKDVKLASRYIYYAIASDNAGNKSERSKQDTILFSDPVKPPMPFNLYAKMKSSGVEITWDEVVARNLKGYFIYCAELPEGPYKRLNQAPITVTKFVDSKGQKHHFYKVTSYNSSLIESPMTEYVQAR